MNESIVFIDSEIGVKDHRIKDLGAVDSNDLQFHGVSVPEFRDFILGKQYVCGHNIIHHDLKYIKPVLGTTFDAKVIDTLYWSPLLFPKNPYHSLLKDDKIQSDELNNPLNDAIKARDLFWDEVAAFDALSLNKKNIYYLLLNTYTEFSGLFDFIHFQPANFDIEQLVKSEFEAEICGNVGIDSLAEKNPIELAYALALIGTLDRNSITPPWLVKNYPNIENIVVQLRETPCNQCEYCSNRLNPVNGLKKYFGFNKFRLFNEEPLQEYAAKAAIEGKSLLAIFPTGGGKSITFQLPALMAGELVHGLTVIISPLQSLMKDQVDNLSERGLTDAVTINGMLSAIERAEAIERVSSGKANLLYLSPEQLRSKTVENLLLKRNVVRFVIDEAHCFSAWGQDFRVDYLYIGDFIREYQKKKPNNTPIAVSCFTATAKQKVIYDIKDYFQRKLDLQLQLFTTNAARENLRYVVLYKETDDEKYNALRTLIEQKDCPTIVYVSRVQRTQQIADKLTSDGYAALPYNGKMESSQKIANQEAFINNQVRVMVATTAFGMGVDKKDVGLVVHYDISDSLENYVQEAGRAGRDQSLQAECYVLFNDNDLDKHFILLNQTKLSISEIQQVWKALKDMTRNKPTVCCSPLEIARQAGWNDTVSDIETRIKTAVSALESAGYVKRGRNVPQIYATSIRVKNMEEASQIINLSKNFESEDQKTNAKRIIKSLISNRATVDAKGSEAESRVDYIADTLGIKKNDVISCINTMRQDGLLSDAMDMSAFIPQNENQSKTSQILERFIKIENFLLSQICDEDQTFALKELNAAAEKARVPGCSVKNIRTVFFYLTIKGYIRKEEHIAEQCTRIIPIISQKLAFEKFQSRIEICRFIIGKLYQKAQNSVIENGLCLVHFSLVELFNGYIQSNERGIFSQEVKHEDIEDALLYLQKIGAMKLEGGFLVLYNGLEVKRMVLDNKIKYKVDDYKQLNEYYRQKIQQIHIVGEYANLMVKDYNAALKFVGDYFTMDFKAFISKYFKGERAIQIEKNITPGKYAELFGSLSDTQKTIINDNVSKRIVVAAGPGSGKTRVLVHKLASLLLLEDVKHEQLLMLTFSRAAATEFKKRLMGLVGGAAHFVEIKTFHSYCFDLMGKIGNIEDSKNIVAQAAAMIANGDVEPGRIMKSVLVIDEAQDMDENEFALVEALMKNNEEMRVIAVGDDDQNIYDFRGASSTYMKSLLEEHDAKYYELLENYRSKQNIVSFSNAFVAGITNRVKSENVTAFNKENGHVVITRHTSKNIEEALLKKIQETYTQGTACVLTSTNNEAAGIVALLTRHGYRAKLIQSLSGLRLANTMELRHFMKFIGNNLHNSPVVSDQLWSEAKAKLNATYSTSSCLEICNKLISDFETINSKTKYWTDLREFITESNIEDFISGEQGTIVVSTIHKSKGHEFDNVYMMLNHPDVSTDEAKRRLYVGMTRAKQNLYIHCNNGVFSNYNIDGVEQKEDYTQYPLPSEVAIQLTHRDVYLDFFKDKKELIFKLQSGMRLKVVAEYLVASINDCDVTVAILSKSCQAEICKFRQLGYEPSSAIIDFIVAWKGENDTDETAIILPTIKLERKI